MNLDYCYPTLRHKGSLKAWACVAVWTALALNPLSTALVVQASSPFTIVSCSSSFSRKRNSSYFVVVTRRHVCMISLTPSRQIIDGGSTGSRLHIFEFVETAVDGEESPQLECVRRGSARANYPLSAFGRSETERKTKNLNATAVAAHMLPTFQYASQQVPRIFWSTTEVYYQATAGMRLLSESEQAAIYDALYAGLMESLDFVFRGLQRSNIATLSGEEEGFYGAVAANFLKGTIDVHMQMIPTTAATPLPMTEARHDLLKTPAGATHSDNHHGPIGALDMGGSSTQIVFLPGQLHRAQDRSEQRSCLAPTSVDTQPDLTCHAASPEEMPLRLNGQDFFATSYLSYGVDQFRERLWTTWVNEHKTQLKAEDSCDAMVLDNPCTFKGYEIEWEGYILVGTGDALRCVQEVQRLIPHPEEPDHIHSLGSHVGGVQHPPVRGKFFAMSLYFFTLDSLRELSHPDKEAYEALNLSWPTPSIAELYNALDGLCSRSWEGDLEDIQHNAHAFTRAEVLPHRCLESVYMVTLLRDGYGFAPESRDITFTFLVDGSEVEWSLGMALALKAQQQDEKATEPAPPESAPRNNADKDRANATEKQGEVTTSPTSSRLFRSISEQIFSTVSSK
jgi:hypothetical protein